MAFGHEPEVQDVQDAAGYNESVDQQQQVLAAQQQGPEETDDQGPGLVNPDQTPVYFADKDQSQNWAENEWEGWLQQVEGALGSVFEQIQNISFGIGNLQHELSPNVFDLRVDQVLRESPNLKILVSAAIDDQVVILNKLLKDWIKVEFGRF